MSKILVSACLAGFPCRYDGKAKTNEEVVALVKKVLQFQSVLSNLRVWRLQDLRWKS